MGSSLPSDIRLVQVLRVDGSIEAPDREEAESLNLEPQTRTERFDLPVDFAPARPRPARLRRPRRRSLVHALLERTFLPEIILDQRLREAGLH